MRDAEEFKERAEKNEITEWHLHDCPMCNYPCGYIFKDGDVIYNAGCDCTSYPYVFEPRSWEDVAAHYNMQEHPNAIAKYDKFWGFELQPVE